ncbi:Tuberous sclerosis 1 protein-like protein, partial [Lachnellula suecica]
MWIKHFEAQGSPAWHCPCLKLCLLGLSLQPHALTWRKTNSSHRSLKDLTKAINASTSNPSIPLPDDLVAIIHAYLEKRSSHDEADSQRLQEELLSIYQTSILDKHSRLAPFLAILRTLTPAIRGNGRLLQWWELLSTPVLNKLGQEKGLAREARDTLLDALVYDEDETKLEDAEATSKTMAYKLVAAWLVKSKHASEEFDEHAKYVEGQIQMILLAFGKKRPKDFLNTINKYFVQKENRILVLSLLCEFIRHQPPHLHQILQTPLFDNLLQCLQTDTSTRVISLAMTALIMCLPHIPSSASKHLPSLFNIYSRMLFWDRERKSPEPKVHDYYDSDDEKNDSAPEPSGDNSWDKLSYLLESEDETVPELQHYFTFLYGLYPINFMSYIRKPQRYLRHANFYGADDLDIEPTEIRQRSEPFRQVHLLHPNFFTMTIESELTDNNRWMTSEAADVVAECMALYSAPEVHDGHASRARTARKLELDSDVPEDALLGQKDDTPFPSRHNSWRNTQSTAVTSSDDFEAPSLHRKFSQTSHSIPSIADSPSLRPSDRLDSPTLPPSLLTSPSHSQLQDLLNGSRPARTSIYQSLTNESVNSLALSHENHGNSFHVDTFLTSLTRDTIPRSPSLRPANADPSLKVAYLHREIQLLRNDLNFERYLKQQHLSHIGQLRAKQIREARVEAETQNLINSNKILKSKLEEAKRLNMQVKSETERSKAHSRKWESDLIAKLKVLREDQKKWQVERDELKGDLEKAKERTEKLKQLVISSESRELSSRQKVQSVESSLDELERLRDQVGKLTLSLRKFEGGQNEAVRAKEGEEAALRKVELMQMELRARDAAHQKARLAFAEEVERLKPDSDEEKKSKKRQALTQDLLDNALADSRNRFLEIQKAHSHLLKRFTSLQSAYLSLKEAQEYENGDVDEPLLGSGSFQPINPGSLSSKPLPINPGPMSSNPHGSQKASPYGPETDGTFPTLSKVDTSFQSKSSNTRSPILSGNGYHFEPSRPFRPNTGTSDESVDSLGNSKPKIKPQSDVRVYGRGKLSPSPSDPSSDEELNVAAAGGVQNIGKKDKAKDKDGAKETSEGKKDKK